MPIAFEKEEGAVVEIANAPNAAVGHAGIVQMSTGNGTAAASSAVTTVATSNTAGLRTRSGLVVRCPFDFSSSSSSKEANNHDNLDEELYTGVHRVTRHPGLWGLGLLGLGSAVLTPFIAEALFLSMPCLFALIGGAHQVCSGRS